MADMKRAVRHSNGPDEDTLSDTERVPLTREEIQALRPKLAHVSPWRVVMAQMVVGGVVAALSGVVTQSVLVALSALVGSAVVVVPAVLMARGMTSKLSSLSPGSSAVSFMLWEMIKIAVSVLLLAAAPMIVQPLSWPALLVAMVVCMKVYWVALLWRGR